MEAIILFAIGADKIQLCLTRTKYRASRLAGFADSLAGVKLLRTIRGKCFHNER